MRSGETERIRMRGSARATGSRDSSAAVAALASIVSRLMSGMFVQAGYMRDISCSYNTTLLSERRPTRWALVIDVLEWNQARV